MKLVSPVMGVEERDAAVTALRAVADGRLLVEHDEHLVKDAAEAMAVAPVYDGDKVTRDPGAKQLGGFAKSSETSRKAALANYPRSGTQRERILNVLLRNGASGATREELAQALGMADNSVRPRVRELVQGGWVEELVGENGKARTRTTHLGNPSEVLVPTNKARARDARRKTVAA
jgi:DNA-binding MarR family transcriptional regulator